MPVHSSRTQCYREHCGWKAQPVRHRGHRVEFDRGAQGYLCLVELCCRKCSSASTSHGLSMASRYHRRHAPATIDTKRQRLQGAHQDRPSGTSAEEVSSGTVWHHVSVQRCVFALADGPSATYSPKAAHLPTSRRHGIPGRYPCGRTPPAVSSGTSKWRGIACRDGRVRTA